MSDEDVATTVWAPNGKTIDSVRQRAVRAHDVPPEFFSHRRQSRWLARWRVLQTHGDEAFSQLPSIGRTDSQRPSDHSVDAIHSLTLR